MTEFQHQNLAAGRWSKLTLVEQLGNVGSEVGRAAARQKEGLAAEDNRALDRAFELLDLTVADPRWNNRLKEIMRAREVLVDAFYGQKEYGSTPADLEKYFYHFAFAARKNH